MRTDLLKIVEWCCGSNWSFKYCPKSEIFIIKDYLSPNELKILCDNFNVFFDGEDIRINDVKYTKTKKEAEEK